MAAFPETRWSQVLTARGDGPKSREALESLCQAYWPPVYHFIRHRGQNHADAQDLTQGFFANLLERRSFDTVDPSKGRLRSFLLTAVTRFMANEHERSMAWKRGGRAVHLPIDAETDWDMPSCDPGHALTPEIAFERAWALRLLDRVLEDLGRTADEAGQGALFGELRGLISFEPPPASYETIGGRLGMSVSAVKAAAHRLRHRYRDALRLHIADTVAHEAEVEDELNHLFEIFSDPPSP